MGAICRLIVIYRNVKSSLRTCYLWYVFLQCDVKAAVPESKGKPLAALPEVKWPPSHDAAGNKHRQIIDKVHPRKKS